MSDVKFTPGPWEVRGFRGLEGPGGREVRFYGEGISLAMTIPSDEERANYALLKAAPEMYDALDCTIRATRAMRNALIEAGGDDMRTVDAILASADAALAKAGRP